MGGLRRQDEIWCRKNGRDGRVASDLAGSSHRGDIAHENQVGRIRWLRDLR
jgi:hypothetical protein